MTTITADLGLMFETIEPFYCSNNAATLGESCGRLTWENALRIAEKGNAWCLTPVPDACEGMQEWARETGAWDAEEIAKWSDAECLALFVQNVASELRDHLDVDNSDLEECVAKYAATDWDKESFYPTGYYYVKDERVCVDYYTGC